jgi:hypothetical protein
MMLKSKQSNAMQRKSNQIKSSPTHNTFFSTQLWVGLGWVGWFGEGNM